jgi:XrtJ-associated TM-motif-TM protein
MIKSRYAVLSAIALLFSAISLHAQATGSGGGCVDSPEAPTVLLVLVGSLGMFYGSSALRKVLRRGGKR